MIFLLPHLFRAQDAVVPHNQLRHICKVFHLRGQHEQFTPGAFAKSPHAVFSPTGKPLLGPGVELWKAASKACNFTYNLQFYPINFKKHLNGSWTGFMGDLVSGRIDCMYGVAAISERYASIDYRIFGI